MSNNRKGRSDKWRKAHSIAARLHQNAMRRGREIAARRTPTSSQLKKRASRMALGRLRMKYAGTKGKSYGHLSQSEKVAVDDLVAKNINSKVISQLTKSLIPKVRQAAAAKKKRNAALTPIVHPTNHSDKKKVNESTGRMLRARLSKKNIAVRRRPQRNEFSAPRMSNQKSGGSDAAFARAATYSLDKANQKIYNTTNDGVGLFKSGRRYQMRKLRKRMRTTSDRATSKAAHHRVRRTTRGWGHNRGMRKSLKLSGLLRNDFDINNVVNVLTEDVAQEKIESLFLRGLVPKHLIQRYRRLLNDPKRYIKFRQYHDEIITLFKTFMEYLTSDDTIFQKVRQQVMAKNHGRI